MVSALPKIDLTIKPKRRRGEKGKRRKFLDFDRHHPFVRRPDHINYLTDYPFIFTHQFVFLDQHLQRTPKLDDLEERRIWSVSEYFSSGGKCFDSWKITMDASMGELNTFISL